MIISKLEDAFRTGGAVEIKEGKRYLVFVDAQAVDAKALIKTFDANPIMNADIQVIFIVPANGTTVAESISVAELESVA